MIIDEQLYIEHHGVRGMHWGIRQSKSKTGISRAGGATMDRNERAISRLKKSKAGRARSLSLTGSQMLSNKTFRKRVLGRKISDLQEQNNRIKKGKSAFDDKLDVWGGTSISGLLISRRPTSSGSTPTRTRKKKASPKASGS